MPDEAALWTFDRFESGQTFGTVNIAMDEAKKAEWVTLFGPSDSSRLPGGMIVAAMMEAYIRAIQPRPNGNVHTSQALSFTGAPARWNDILAISVSCRDKEERKGRKWVSFGVEASANGQVIMTGTIRSIWAA